MAKSGRRNICFVTGTRAEFGLMVRTLEAIRRHPALNLQLVATGMHLDRSRGYSLGDIRRSGWKVDATVPWPAAADQTGTAVATGKVMGRLAATFERLKSHVVLVVGDRVEAFAAASAAHVGGRCVAHVHGGDRALGLVDDSLRHAITKLSHIHFPATAESKRRILKLGEDRSRVHQVGSPGLDGIRGDAANTALVRQLVGGAEPFVLVSLHPAAADDKLELKRATALLRTVQKASLAAVVVYPNNDPGSGGIVECYERFAAQATSRQRSGRMIFYRTLPRAQWLGLLREATVLIGNSSSGIIEAASFGTPVIDIGPRQQGREHGSNVLHCDYEPVQIDRLLQPYRDHKSRPRLSRRNLYGQGTTGIRIAALLAEANLNINLLRKLITY